jgi:Fe-S cluster assembly protein SufD
MSGAQTAEARFQADFLARAGQLSANGHSWLAPMRSSAIERFVALGLPTLRDEDWRKTDLRALASTDFRPAVDVAASDPDAVAARVAELSFPDIESHRLVFVNGRLAPEHSQVGTLPEGVRVESLARTLDDAPQLAQPHLGHVAQGEDDAFGALNTAFMTDGAFVIVPDGGTIQAPVHLIFLAASGADGAPVAHYPRNLYVIGDGSRATVLETYAGLDDDGSVYLTNALSEAVVGTEGTLTHYKRQQESESAFHVARLEARQEDRSTITNFNIALGGRLARTDVGIHVDGSFCETLLKGLYMGHREQHIDNITRLDHALPDCHSHERYKGILDGQASAVFTGRILVRQDAQKTDAIQENSGLLLSRDATINTQPQLEIFADDVKCTHGATVGELPENQLFYLRARGIPAEEATGILTYAYANEIIELIEIEPLRAQLEQLIRRRVRERFASLKR